MKKISVKKLLVIALSMFIIYNLVWFLTTTIKYDKYTKAVPKNEYGLHYTVKDGYTYNIKKPFFFSFTGNLAVTKNGAGKSLIIWPKIFGGYTYGFHIRKDESDYQIYVDKNYNPINKDDEVTVQKVNECKTELEELFSKANEMWQLK